MHEFELDVERAFDGQEEIQVDEDADQGKEDLLHRICPEDAREGRACNDRREHQQHYQRTETRRQDPVQRHRGRVAREDVEPSHPTRIRDKQNRVPAEASHESLDGLERDRPEQILDRDLRDRVPELGEPLPDVPTEQVRDSADDDDDQGTDKHALEAESPL